MSFSYKGFNLDDILSAKGSNDASNNTMTNYNINGTAQKFLKPFYAGTTSETTYDADPRMYATVNFLYQGVAPKFCPAYQLFGGNANTANAYTQGTTAVSTVTPPNGVTRMLVIVVGGGGGGGGGGSKSGGGAGGGGGGGSGGISIYSIDIVSGSFTVTVGYGGRYGYTDGNSAGGPGDEDNVSPNNPGYAGEAGLATTFEYNGQTYRANGGNGGGGGPESTSAGTGGTGATSYTIEAIYYAAGNAGANGGTGSTPNVGGAGGKPKYTSHINLNLINLISTQASLNTNNIATTYKLQYGEGGNGGKGDNTSSYGWNGEFGAPGCALVFYFY